MSNNYLKKARFFIFLVSLLGLLLIALLVRMEKLHSETSQSSGQRVESPGPLKNPRVKSLLIL